MADSMAAYAVSDSSLSSRAQRGTLVLVRGGGGSNALQARTKILATLGMTGVFRSTLCLHAV